MELIFTYSLCHSWEIVLRELVCRWEAANLWTFKKEAQRVVEFLIFIPDLAKLIVTIWVDILRFLVVNGLWPLHDLTNIILTFLYLLFRQYLGVGRLIIMLFSVLMFSFDLWHSCFKLRKAIIFTQPLYSVSLQFDPQILWFLLLRAISNYRWSLFVIRLHLHRSIVFLYVVMSVAIGDQSLSSSLRIVKQSIFIFNLVSIRASVSVCPSSCMSTTSSHTTTHHRIFNQENLLFTIGATMLTQC